MKKEKQILLTSTLTFALLLGSVPINRSEAASVPKLKDKKIIVVKGKTKTIKVKGKRIQKKKFKSSKKSIATVTKKGKVTGKKAGSCKIKITVKYRKSKRYYKKIYKTFGVDDSKIPDKYDMKVSKLIPCRWHKKKRINKKMLKKHGHPNYIKRWETIKGWKLNSYTNGEFEFVKDGDEWWKML